MQWIETTFKFELSGEIERYSVRSTTEAIVMQQETRHLEYRVEPTYRRRSRLWFGLGLAVVALALFGLRKLETMPYRPPYDMSTFLGEPELAFVRAMMVLFAVVWCVLLIGFVVSFRPPRPAA